MSPLALAGVWMVAGLAGTALARLLHRRQVAILAPALAGLAGGAAAVAVAPGPAASIRYGGTLILGRPELGLVVVAGLAAALTLALAPHIDGGEVLAICTAGAASVVAMSATVPVVWAVALAVGVGAVSLRWIAAAPNRATLAAGRIAGMGVAALLAAAVVIPTQNPPSDVRAALAGALLAGGVGALLGLVPAGGWAAGASAAVRGGDFAAWGLILAPAVLLSASEALSALRGRTADAFADTLLLLGLLSAVYGGVQAVLTEGVARYGRLLLADVGLAAAGIGCRQDAGRLGILLILVGHLCAGPLLLNPSRPGLERAHRLAWLALSGAPPSISFWGRLLILEGLVATNGLALLAALTGGAAMLVAAMRGLVHPEVSTDGAPARVPLRVLGWTLAVGAIVLGFAPAWVAGHLFGVDLGAG